MTSLTTSSLPRRPLKICYAGTSYESLQRAGTAYLQLLRSGYDHVVHITSIAEAARDIAGADVVILHVGADLIEEVYACFPLLKKKYVIGYLVWEASTIPEKWMKAISCLQEIWTASQYCRSVFLKYHNRVICIPHVVERDVSCSMNELAYMKDSIGYQEDHFYFLTIAAPADRRKNVDQLLEAFLSVSSHMKHARLIVKSCWEKDPATLTSDKRVVYLRKHFTPGQLNALYQLSNAYVSAHHSEGWGFTLSDAMLFKKPVIATRYSGNLEYMNDANSFLIGCQEAYIRPQDSTPSFSVNMKWAYPDRVDLQDKLLLVYNNITQPWVEEKVERALSDAKKFDGNAVGTLIQQRLLEISTFVQEGHRVAARM